ncbi:hypothetical protein MK805_02125 [Shimazuella sp. AN120528]|nr:hypothetical protein [Shimazuella soli]MCH5583764.1 hypothetical protein [Shimazuella soli]
MTTQPFNYDTMPQPEIPSEAMRLSNSGETSNGIPSSSQQNQNNDDGE